MISSSEKDVKLHQANRANNLFIACVDLQELEKLSQKFEENDLDATNKVETFMVEKREIEGRVATYCSWIGCTNRSIHGIVFLYFDNLD